MVDWIHLWEGGVEHMLRIQVHEDAHDSASNVANHCDEEDLCMKVSGESDGAGLRTHSSGHTCQTAIQ